MYKIGVIGYGYVGKLIATRLSHFYETICYDCDNYKISKGIPINSLVLTNNRELLKECNVYIITVQTPLDVDNKPDLNYLIESTNMLTEYIDKGDTIIYESTVFPGVTEKICIPLIEKNSGLKVNEDFFVVYSPERVSPGDIGCNIEDISKIISASSQEAKNIAIEIYSKVTNKDLYIAPSIKVAEAAKLLENLQRDINIALMNEYFFVLKEIGIDFFEVLKAAKTKWNFNIYYPGFVGGHCIGIDTQYYIHLAKSHNINPVMGESARFTNEKIIEYISELVIATQKKFNKFFRVGILGVTYKPNCDDIRNSAALKIIRKLKKNNKQIETIVFDPIVDECLLNKEEIYLSKYADLNNLDILLCVSYHDVFKKMKFSEDMFSDKHEAIVIDLYKQLQGLQKYNLLYL